MKPDNNYFIVSDLFLKEYSDLVVSPPNAADYDDIFKVSGSSNITVRDCTINPDGGNREDGVDIMRYSKYIDFQWCKVGAGKKYGFTIKGGSNNVTLRDCTITRGGGNWERVDIDIGNWSTTTPAKTGVVTIDHVTRTDGKPVRVRVGWADQPVVIGPKVHILFWQSLGLKIYCLVRRALLKLS
jgi:pectate lyase